MNIKWIEKFKSKPVWDNLSDGSIFEIKETLSKIIPPINDEELAKRFDLLMFTIEFAHLTGMDASRSKSRVVETAVLLESKGNIAKIEHQADMIRRVQKNEFWTNANLFDYEEVRLALRDLLRYLDKDLRGTFYTDFKDEITESVAGEPDFNVNKLDNYKKRVEHYLKGQRRDISVNKLRNNLPLGHRDLVHFEQILWNDLGSRDEYVEFYGNTPLLELVSGIVGLEPQAANKHFSTFLSDNSLNSQQREFVNMIVTYTIQNGLLPKEDLRNTPFDKFGSITDLFDDRMDTARELVGCIDKINTRIEVA
jgi:type I restriction enzyme R subunit